MSTIFKIDRIDYSKSDLSYRLFENLQAIFNDATINFERCDFRGSKFTNCTFQTNNFDRADFIDCFIEDTTFRNVNFGISLFKNSYFEDVIFRDNTYQDLSVQNCTFKGCTFDEISIIWTLFDCKFINCIFNNTAFDHSSIDNNTFIDCVFIKCNLAECHMENIRFQSCTLNQVELDNSYVSTYLLRDTDFSKIRFKYRGDYAFITQFGQDEIKKLYTQKRYFNYLNMLLLANDLFDFYEKTIDAIKKTLTLNKQQRIYNLKNIFEMFEFYYGYTLIDFVTYQKIVIYLNSLNFDNYEFEEYGMYGSILYRINKLNKIENATVAMLNTISPMEQCICKIHIDNTDYSTVKAELTNIFSTINSCGLNNVIESNKYYEVKQIESGSIILTIAASLVLILFASKVIKSINHDIQIMRIEKAATDATIEKIKKAKTSKQIQKIKSEELTSLNISTKNYDKSISALSNSLLIGEIISIVISLII